VTLPARLEPHKGKLALVAIAVTLLIATEATAPALALAAAGLAGVFYASGWLSIPQAALGLALAGAGLGLVGMRKRS